MQHIFLSENGIGDTKDLLNIILQIFLYQPVILKIIFYHWSNLFLSLKSVNDIIAFRNVQWGWLNFIILWLWYLF